MARIYLANGKVTKKIEATPSTTPKVQKEKTPVGHIRFNEKIFSIETSDLPKDRLFCNACRAKNARIIGQFSDDEDTTQYVVKCPWHPNDSQIISEDVFREKYPDILPKKANPNSDFPLQKSYCRNCRGTTGKIVGETEISWLIKCPCGEEWFENKLRFAEKYIGTNDTPPLFRQRNPVIPKNWCDQKSTAFPFQKLKEIIPTGIMENNTENKSESNVNNVPTSSLAQNESRHEEENIQLDINGITLSVPKGATVKLANGKLFIEFK